MDQIRPFPPTDLIDQAEEEDAIRLAPAVELKDWVIQNFLTLGGELHNPDHDHIAALLHDDETFLTFAWASSACMAKKRMVLGQCEKVMFNQGGWKKARQEQQMRDWFGYVPVYLITIDASFCENSNDRDFCALIEHELYHIGVERDEDGEIIYSDHTGLPKHYLAAHDVEEFNQGTNWTGVLFPLPALGALSISYMAQGKFYVLKDNGTGRLVGANSAVGSGTVNYQTGSWLLTTGALPDVGTPILLQWGSPITTFARANLAVLPAAIEFDLGQEGVKSGSVNVTWLLEGVTKTATSNAQGQFTGDAIGSINYAAGTGKLIPNKLPQKGTVFNFVFDYGEPESQVVTSVVPDANNKLIFSIGTGAAIQPNSVELDIPLTNQLLGAGGSVLVTDVPISGTLGNLVDRLGNVMGTINYTTGAVEITPHASYTRYTQSYTSQSYYLATG